MIVKNDQTLNIDGFIISQDLYNQITANALFGIEKKDESHLGHDEITWTVNEDIKCNDCNMCDSCQGECYNSCYDSCASCDECLQCTSACVSSCDSECFNCAGGCTASCYSCDGCQGACTEGCVSQCYECQNHTGPQCWTNCFDKCQGACTSKCQSACYSSCQGGCTSGCNSCNTCQNCQEDCQSACYNACAGGCTSGCNEGCQNNCYGCTGSCRGCFSACTSSCTTQCDGCDVTCTGTGVCYGCQACNSCQTCVGASCVSCNGSCTSVVRCLGAQTCDECYLLVYIGGCSYCIDGQGCGGGQVVPDKPSPEPPNARVKVKSAKCPCYGCQNTVTGNEGCGKDYGYGGTDTIEFETDHGTLTLTVAGEKVVAGGGSERTASDLAIIASLFQQSLGMEIDKDANIELRDESGNLVESLPWTTLLQREGVTTCEQNTGGTSTCYANTGVTESCSNGTSTHSTCYGGVGQACAYTPGTNGCSTITSMQPYTP